MKNLKEVILIIVVMICLVILTITITENNNTKILTSKTGCCSITSEKVNDHHYNITYYDNINNTSTTEVETTPQDADYMINLFQDYCMETHPIELWENY